MNVNGIDYRTGNTMSVKASVIEKYFTSAVLSTKQARCGMPNWKNSPSYQHNGSCWPRWETSRTRCLLYGIAAAPDVKLAYASPGLST